MKGALLGVKFTIALCKQNKAFDNIRQSFTASSCFKMIQKIKQTKFCSCVLQNNIFLSKEVKQVRWLELEH